MPSITIRPRTPDDDERIVTIWNAIYPDFPPETVEEQRHYIDNTPQSAHAERHVAEQDGEVVGNSRLTEMYWNKEPGSYLAYVGVDRQRWGQGIGSLLYDSLLRSARQLKAARLYSHMLQTDSESERFATKRDFVDTGRTQRMSRLNVHAANLEGYDGVEERVEREGLRLATLAEIGPDNDQFMRMLYELDMKTTRDIPSSEPFESQPYENWYADIIEAPGTSPHTLWIALDGEKPVGMALLTRQGTNAGWNSYTGVDRAYRGKGVARALKLRTIEWARDNGVDYIYTGNDIDNQRMLAVNIRLGYEPLPAFAELVKHLDGSESN